MSSNSKKWFLFVNLLFSLTLSNNLLAVEKQSSDAESGTIPDTDAHGLKKKFSPHVKQADKSLATLIEREEKLMRRIAEANLLIEEAYIEQLHINEHFKNSILEEELFLEHLNFSNKSSNQKLFDSNTSSQATGDLQALELSINAIYHNDKSAQEKIANILSQGEHSANSLPQKKLAALYSPTKKLVHESIALLTASKSKTAESFLASKTALNKRESLEETAKQKRSLERLIELKDTAALLAHEKSQSEAIAAQIATIELDSKPNNISRSGTILAKDILERKNNLKKLSALKATATEIYSEQIKQIDNTSVELKDEGLKLDKLAKLKSLQTELVLENTQQNKLEHSNLANDLEPNDSIETHELTAYLQGSKINYIETGHQNYTLLNTKANLIPETVKQVTEGKTIEEKIDFGVKIGEKKDIPNPAEIEEITGEIAPILDSVELDPEATELLLVDSKMNSKESVITTVVAFNESKNLIYAPLETIKNWGIQGPYPESVDFQGQELVPLHDMHNIVANLDRGSLRLNLSAPTKAFSHQVVNFNDRKKIAPAYSDLGLYLNYDTLYTKSENSRALTNALFSPVIFSNFGYFSNRIRYLSDVQNGDSNFTRLESYFQKDFPSRLTSLRIGDSISSSGDWGRSSVFTGIQYGTNFSTQPEFLTTPLPSLFSETNAPSTVDIYINDRLARNVNVEPGPFEIRNIPPLNGNGQIQFVIRDELGRERIITTDFYSNNSLLRPGVVDYSINLGVERQNVGRANANYGSALGVFNYRRGISNTLTLGGRGEFSRDTNNVGLSANYTLGNKGTINASTAFSNNILGNAALWRLGYRYSRDQFNFASTYQKSDEDFRFIGQNSSINLLSQITLSTGYNTQDYGSFSFSHVKQNLTTNDRSVNSFSYGKTFKSKYSLGFYASKAQDDTSFNDTQFGLTFSTSFANGSGFSSSYSKNGNQNRLNNTYQKSSQELLTPSYRVNTTNISGLPASLDIDASTRTQYFDVDARFNQRNDINAHQVGAYGSFALLKGGYWGFTRDIADSFAVVKVADFENVGVYQQNRFIGRTNDKGYLIAPDLNPYLENNLRFDPIDVPLDTTFKTDETQIVPYSKSGVLVDFEIERSTSYSFTAVDERGRLLNLGTTIKIDDEHTSIVGYDGLVFVQVPESVSTLSFAYGRNGCTIDLPTTTKPHRVTGIISSDKLVCKYNE